MSPAAVDFRSLFTSPPQMQSKQQQSFTPQNPNPNSGLSFDFGAFASNNLPNQGQGSLRGGSETNDGKNVDDASPFVSQISSEKFNCSSVSRRSKPRLVKVRRQLGSQQGKSASVPAQNDSGLNPSQYISENCVEVKNATSCTSNGFSASIGDVKSEKLDNVGFASGANESSFMVNLNSGNEQCSGTLGQAGADGFGRTNNLGLLFGVSKSNSDLNSNSEHKESGKDVGQFGASEFGKFENVGFVFGTNKSSSIKNSISEKGQASGSVQQSGANEFGQFNDLGFVFGANKSNSLSNKNSEQRASTENVGQLHADELRKFENGSYVFGANSSNFMLNLNLEKGQHGESAEKSEAGEFHSPRFGSKPAISASSSIFESREPSINVGMFDDGRGIKEKNKAEFRKLDDNGFVFGTKHGDLKSNSSLEKKESSENVEKSAYGVRGKMKLDVGKVDNLDFVFGGNWSEPRSNLDSVKSESSENGGQSVPVDSQKMKSGAQLGMFDNMGFVFGAYPKGSSSISDFQKRESSESAGILDFEDGGKMKVDIEVELQKANANDVFMFESSSKKNSSFSESTKLTDEMNKVKSENSGNCTGFVNANTDKLGSDVNNIYNFVFGSSVYTTSASGTSTVRKLSHEMRKLTVDDCEKVGCSGNNKDPNIKSCASSNDVFVFGSSKKPHSSCTGKWGTTSCDQITNSNLEGAGNDSAVEKTEGINARTIGENIFVFASSNDAACSFGGGAQHVMPNEKNTNTRSGLGVLDEQIKLGCPFGKFWEENQPANVNEKSSDDPSVGMSTPKPFTFQAGLGKSCDGPRDQLNDDPKLNKTSNQSVFLSNGLQFEAPPIGRVENKDEFSFISTPVGVRSTTMDFRTPNGDASCSFTMNLYPGLNRKLEFLEKSRPIRDKRWYKTRGKLRQTIRVQQQSRQNIVSKEGSQQNLESPGCYSPMDYSPYQDNNCVASTVNATSSTHAKDEDLAAASGANTSDGEQNCREPNEEVSKNHDERCIADSSLEKGETECSNSKSEQISINSGNGGGGVAGDGVSSNIKREESECKMQFCFASSAEDICGRNFTFSAASAQDNFSATNRQNRKKYRMKVGRGPNCTTPSRKVDTASSSVQFSPLDGSCLHLNQAQDKEGDILDSQRKGENKSKGDEEHDKRGFTAASLEACENWRIRGNQAYEKGHLSKAEEFYSKGINSVPHSETSGCCIGPLVLCYSNRAAARMSCGRMREALGDCMRAAALDANFHKVQIRAANCHLALGEVEDALQYFTKCLESGGDVCLDRRTIIEAANGLQKAQKLAECMNQCAELLRRRTSNAATSALEIISAVLLISSYSEKLLEMKGESLLMLRRYEEVIQLCEQTLVCAEKNFSMVAGDNNLGNADDPKYNSSIRLWRWRLMSKAYFHLGRLEVALDLLEKQELLKSADDRCGSNTQESLMPFAVTVRELLHRKNAGNEAYQSGRHTEAVEHYTAVVSSSIESRPFAAICFCNRAAAHQALGQIADAIADCSLAIALDQSYSKAVSRRATLQETIRDYEQAASDLQRLISLLEKQSQEKVRQSGSNGKELRQARRRLSSVEENTKKGISLDHYLILGVKPSDTAPEIKKAYRKAALRHHPDKAGQFLARSESGDDGQLWKEIADEVHKDADRLFKMIGEAYAVLSDPTKRSQYDLQEELRNAQKESNGSRTSRRSSDFYSSPYESSANRRYWQESWKTHGNSRSQW